MSETEPPTVGSIVHYVSHGSPVRADGTQEYPSVCRVAIVTELDLNSAYRLGLCVMNPTGFLFRPLETGGAVWDKKPGEPGTWHAVHEPWDDGRW